MARDPQQNCPLSFFFYRDDDDDGVAAAPTARGGPVRGGLQQRQGRPTQQRNCARRKLFATLMRTALIAAAVAAGGAAAAATAAAQQHQQQQQPSSVPPTRHLLPLLSMQPAFCQKQFGTNYVWLAQAHLACMGMSAKGCGGSKCGTLSINGHNMTVTNYNSNNNDVCGSCEGCPIVFIGFSTPIPASAHAIEGKDAALIYYPPAGDSEPSLPNCPALPPAWKALPNQQISPACSPSESKGSLGATASAAECLSKAQANGDVNYAVWRGDTDKSCEACAFRWRGPAAGWKYNKLSGATSFAWYLSLPPPKPSVPCPACPPNPVAATVAPPLTLSNELIVASFGPRGLNTLSSRVQAVLGKPFNVSVGNDGFSLGLDEEK